ncbi:alpha/beta fold hydrolase [Egibacter rhizosphaerae]|uniref:Alpha/beta fold hydrolase n=1 Tax=Egibacter rhizosphaerae TaxID=1670831 RepID=A0A411YH41_9ACTN|nr:alpha/beta fold hydrolase [Egibacter rhizosphaerae]QBI20578.1 alpha/beta fold hydrolase [Egibacter rhizosphaerae]
MVRARAIGLVAFGAATLGGAALGYLGERRVMAGQAQRVAEADPSLAAAPGWASRDVESHDRTLLHAELRAAPGRPAVLFSHGLGLSSRVWHDQMTVLGERFHSVAFDHRGHGQSARAARGDYTLDALADDVAAVLAETAPAGPAVLVGHSLGGMAVLACAARHPGLLGERVRGLVLTNTAASRLFSGAARSTLAAAVSTVQARVYEAVVARSSRARRRLESDDPEDRPSTDLSLLATRQFGLNPEAPPELVAFLERELRGTPPVVLGACAPALTTVDLQDVARELTVPTLVLAGSRDRLTPPRQAQRLAEMLPDSELVTIEGAGHTAMLEQPDAVTAAIDRFAARVTADAGGGDGTSARRASSR